MPLSFSHRCYVPAKFRRFSLRIACSNHTPQLAVDPVKAGSVPEPRQMRHNALQCTVGSFAAGCRPASVIGVMSQPSSDIFLLASPAASAAYLVKCTELLSLLFWLSLLALSLTADQVNTCSVSEIRQMRRDTSWRALAAGCHPASVIGVESQPSLDVFLFASPAVSMPYHVKHSNLLEKKYLCIIVDSGPSERRLRP